MIQSAIIARAVEIACAAGNEVAEVSEGWQQVRQVVHMKEPIAQAVRLSLSSESKLRHWKTHRTPHNQAQEGFTDDTGRVAITFPEE